MTSPNPSTQPNASSSRSSPTIKQEEKDASGATNTPDTQVSTTPEQSETIKKLSTLKVQEPPTFMDLPDSTKEATSKFSVISISTYTPKSLGDAPEESMACDCRPEYVDGVNHACGEDSGCINLYTKMECTGASCGCGEDCQNMRFQKKEYADVSVIKTEFKGFGLRANTNLETGAFIYEYIGEVIDENRFRKRRVDYDKEGIKHFYFMSLGKNEFVDATKKGNLARFCNHSCNPNCYVDKWIVGTKFRMGIFAKRNIRQGEELTFDYNVDRYGAEATKCYCGEPNCLGYIGGKTQTDGKATTKVSDQIADALGVHHEPGRRKNRTVGIDEAFVQVLIPRPLEMEDVQAVVSVLLTNSEVWIVQKVLERVNSCELEEVQGQIMRLHGYQIMKGLLRRFDKKEICCYILEIMDKWPRLTKNKITSSGIEEVIQGLAESEDEDIGSRAKKLLAEWAKLETGYRIPRRIRTEADSETPTEEKARTPEASKPQEPPKPIKPSGLPFGRPHVKKFIPGAPAGPRAERMKQEEHFGPLPSGWSIDVRNGRRVYVSYDGVQIQERFPTAPYVAPRTVGIDKNKLFLQAIMEQAEASVAKRRAEEKLEQERREREAEARRRAEEEERINYQKSLDALIRRDVEEERRAAKEKRKREEKEKRRREKREAIERKLGEKDIERALLKTHGPVIANIMAKKSPWNGHKSNNPPPPPKEDWKLLVSWGAKKIVASEMKRKGDYYCNLRKVPEKGTPYYSKMEAFVGEAFKKGRNWVLSKIKALKEEAAKEGKSENSTPTNQERGKAVGKENPDIDEEPVSDKDDEEEETPSQTPGGKRRRSDEEEEEIEREVKRRMEERMRESGFISAAAEATKSDAASAADSKGDESLLQQQPEAPPGNQNAPPPTSQIAASSIANLSSLATIDISLSKSIDVDMGGMEIDLAGMDEDVKREMEKLLANNGAAGGNGVELKG